MIFQTGYCATGWWFRQEQMLVCEKLKEIQPDFKKYVEDGGVVIAICGGYQLLGKYYKTDQGTISGTRPGRSLHRTGRGTSDQQYC